MNVGAIPPVPLCLSVCFLTCSFFGFPFLSRQRGWNSSYKAVLSNKHQSSWAQFVPCSIVQSHQRSPAVGLLGSLEALPSRQSLASTDKALSGWVTCLLSQQEIMPRDGEHNMSGVLLSGGWRGGVTRQLCSQCWHRASTQSCHDVPTQMRSEIPSCTVLAMACALKGHRTEQNYCRSKVLTSSLGSLCWLLIWGN